MGPSLQSKSELLEQTDEYVVSVWRRLMLLVWRDKANASGVERSRALFDQWAASEPRGAGFLVVIPGQRTRPPDDATREAMQRAALAPSARCQGMATLLEAEGFVAASVRAIMMRLHARSEPVAPNVFGATAEAADWAATLLKDPDITQVGLADAIRAAREGWSKIS